MPTGWYLKTIKFHRRNNSDGRTERKMKITGAIFDFDGTLFDSMHVWVGIREKFFDRIGLRLSAEDEEAFRGMYLRESLLLAKEKGLVSESYDELFNMFFDYIKELYLADTAPKKDIRDFLEKLKKSGVKMGIATATGEPALEAVLEKFGMLGYFEAIISTYTVGAAKTEPKVYDAVLERLGTPKETTWIFEDALYAARTAKANGYNVVGIYDKSEPDGDGLKELADVYIHSYGELEINGN